jgi:hypothetical protein
VVLGDFLVVHSDFHVVLGDFHVFLGDFHEFHGGVYEKIVLKIKDLAFSRRDHGGAWRVAARLRRAGGAEEKRIVASGQSRPSGEVQAPAAPCWPREPRADAGGACSPEPMGAVFVVSAPPRLDEAVARPSHQHRAGGVQ